MSATPRVSALREMFKGTALYGLALVVQRLGSMILLPVNTHYLEPRDIGILDLVEQTGTIISVLMGLNYSSALGYFYFEQKDDAGREKVAGTILSGSLLVGGIAAIFTALAAPFLSRLIVSDDSLTPYLFFCALYFPMGALLDALLAWVRVINRPLDYFWASLLRLAMTVAATATLLAVFHFHVWAVMLSNGGSTLLVTIGLLLYFLRRARFHFDRPLFAKMLRYALPIGASWFALFIIHYGDRFLLPRFRGLNELGIYAIAYKIGMLISVIHMSFHQYWSAQVFGLMQREDAKQLFSRTLTYLVTGMSFGALGMVVFCGPGLRVLTRQEYWVAAGVVPILVAAYTIRAIGDYYRTLFYALNRTGAEAVCNWLGAIVCLAGYLWLIPPYGMWGAAIATLAAFTTTTLSGIVWTHRLWAFPVEVARTVKAVGLLAALLATYYAFPCEGLWTQFAMAGALTVAYPLLLWALRFPSAAEMAILGNQLAKLRR